MEGALDRNFHRGLQLVNGPRGIFLPPRDSRKHKASRSSLSLPHPLQSGKMEPWSQKFLAGSTMQ
ncbi:hypothetical protein E2C01_053845 [Portunus trituberculatus]|uniref:Uncharacterized protein n=1 Tax=Portunus trituberculatus TaxID=210409 RepID=A0A5B7GRX6_PORTR|nr:hypothetical protein [Portunus trituberculatus]